MKHNKHNIGIIGFFCGGLPSYNGQTIKTRTLFNELKKDESNKIIVCDTWLKKKPFKLLFSLLHVVFSCNHIFVLVSTNGMKTLFPFLSMVKKLLKKHVYHDVIGGNFPNQIKNNKKMIKATKAFDINLVESRTMVAELNNMGIFNVKYLPNFKDMKPIYKPYNESIFKFCTFSRVSKDKGIADAIESLSFLIKRFNYPLILDVYGPIHPSFKEEFFALLEKNDFVHYCGIIEQQNITDTLSKYFALLFPTYWKGEGFPGTIIDAFFSSIPVIASDFSCNKEIVNSLSTGLIYPSSSADTLTDAIHFSIVNYELFRKMRRNCFEESKKYSSEYNMRIIKSYIGGEK